MKRRQLLVGSLATAAIISLPRPAAAATRADRILFWRPRVTAHFPYLPDAIRALPDSAPGTPANVRFVDLDANGIPGFECRADFTIDELTAYHEMGHENEAQLQRAGLTKDFIRTQWWTFRGFPGTWQQQQADVDSGFYGPPSSQGYWDNSPVEMVAEALKCAVYGYTGPTPGFDTGGPTVSTERTQNFGRPVNHDSELKFWQDLWQSRNVEVHMRTLQLSLTLTNGDATAVASRGTGIALNEAQRAQLRLMSIAGQDRSSKYGVDIRRNGLTGDETSLPDTRGWLTEDLAVGIGQPGRWKLNVIVRRDFGGTGFYLACIDDVTGSA